MCGACLATRQPPPTCVPELRRALLAEWSNIPQDQLYNLILSMPSRCTDCISWSGRHTRFPFSEKMTRNQDARPFVDLLKDAEEFKAKFDDDIKKCIEFLDEKITALIRDPDSLGNPKRGANSNPVVEFSKAKYEIFVGAKSLMNEMEREWLKYISEMKKLFIENVEIFLAGTKLEVKLPTSEFQSSPALSSPLRVKDNIAKKQSSKKTSNDFQLSSSDETSEDDLVKTGRKSSRFSESLKPTVRITKADESAAKASQRKSFLSQADTDSDSSESDTNVFSKTPGRASRRAPAEEIPQIGATKSPKKVTFTKEQVDDDDDLDIYTPAKVSKPAIRRKTLLPNLDDISDINSGNSSRSKTKRKTIAVSDLRAITPSKRLKVSESMKSVSSSQDDEDTDDNPLESDGNYTHWIPLKSVDAKIPARPAIYEVKVSRAKKSAYIGSCDSLRQKLTVYKLRHNSGHKHLDKFIDRNMNDIQIRYEVVSSENDAKTEVKNRINSFVAQYKTTPAYN